MRARCVVAAAVLAQSWACTSMQSVPAEFIAQARPSVVELKGEYGRQIAVQNPRVSGDTIYGTAPGGNAQVAVPLHHVDMIATKRFSSSRTALLIGGGLAAAGIAAFFIATSGNSEPELDCGIDNPVDPADRERCGV